MKSKFFLCLLLMLSLAACSIKNGASISSCEQLASHLLKDLDQKDQLERVKDRVVKGLFFQNEQPYEEAVIYRSRKEGTAEMIAVIRTKKKDKVKVNLKDYLVELKRKMVNQYPNEVFKVSNAVLSEADEYVVLVIHDNIELASQKVNGYLSQLRKEKK
ncbi:MULTISPECIES: DUF4358 domain-containing protein [Terrabacteria group]|uniref:DUF4358 domain-containing protein n=1 Tax=Bacillati TaxID=1783272 RepID=UPI00193A9E85|nr:MULTISPECIES: DUF4358 domain-containing protein [Terrabacteria group]MBW9213052.1 DUF4358 domain-containing protein [Trueperella sp. zg.1013]QRG87427.1 DUF4358 domain-containing protein [Bulleidia sp. zg-1006]